jgi:hypothetical protein
MFTAYEQVEPSMSKLVDHQDQDCQPTNTSTSTSMPEDQEISSQNKEPFLCSN